MSNPIHCFELMLGKELPAELPSVVVLYGDDSFLRSESTRQLLELAKINADEVRYFDGEDCKWIDVHDELATLSLFGSDGLRVAVVKGADPLVKDARSSLEKWCQSPAKGSLLVMSLGTFPATTNLYKQVVKFGWAINCGLPTSSSRSKTVSQPEMKKWITAWGKQRHGLSLSATQSAMILDIVGNECGLLHQELAKLALYATGGKLTDEQIQTNIGSWRTRTMWDIADAIVEGRIDAAMTHLHGVFASGEQAAGIVPQLAWSLRRYGNAAQLILQNRRVGRSVPLGTVIGQCGFFGRDLQLAEGRLKRMGLKRASKILSWLLELDLKTKGSHSSPDRAAFALEEFVLRFAEVAPTPTTAK